jgi:hypothetical protein
LPAPQRTARIEDDIWTPAQARAHAEGASLAALMRAAVQRYADGDLTSQALPASQPAPDLTSHLKAASQPPASVTSQAAAAFPAALDTGRPSPGVLCMTPKCFQRDTRTYGLRDLPLCTACAHALAGETWQRPITPAQARAIRKTAA